MTREEYFNMCEAIGSKPVEEEIPIEFEELSIQSQEAIYMFDYFPDDWDSFSGYYKGKDLKNIFVIFELFEISSKDEQLLYMELLKIIVEERISSVNKKIKREAKASGGKNNSRTGIPS